MLAAHRGSVLGELPGAPQPTQKAFETAIWTALSAFDPARPVFVESESRKVGNLRVPEALIDRMREGECLRLEAGPSVRVALLLEDYAHLVAEPRRAAGEARLPGAPARQGADRALERARRTRATGRRSWPTSSQSHYDPAYHRSMFRNYAGAARRPPSPCATPPARRSSPWRARSRAESGA